MLRKSILTFLHNPIICNNINNIKYPWGWRSNSDVDKIINLPIKKLNENIDHLPNNHELKYIHEYKIKEYAEEMYTKTYYAYLNNYDFLNTYVFSPKLGIGLNQLRSISNINNLKENIKVNNVKVIDSWIKHGSVKNINKFLGFYNHYEILHEINAGIIGPEASYIWDQKSLKQKIRLCLESSIGDDKRKDVLDFERDLMTTNGEWIMSNINLIVK